MIITTDKFQQVVIYLDFQLHVIIQKDSHAQQLKCFTVLQMLLLDMDPILMLLRIQSYLTQVVSLVLILPGIVDLVDKDFHVRGFRP